MEPISFDEILNLHEYETARPDFRRKVIERKKRRRVADPAQVQPTLDRMVGLDEPGRVGLRSGNLLFPARFAAGQSREDRISAVHYIRFPLGDEGRTALRLTGSADIEVDHGGCSARTALPPETVEELREDLER